MIVIVRLRYCERTRSYMDRRLTEGKTKKEAIRCLKRFVARELYRTSPRRPRHPHNPHLTSIGTSQGPPQPA